MPLSLDLKKYMSPYFVETGTYHGEGLEKAIQAGFMHIHSIEIDKDRCNNAANKFAKHKNVRIHHGDTVYCLWSVISRIRKPITFWLDAHYSGFGKPPPSMENPFPLLPELFVINALFNIDYDGDIMIARL